MLPRPPIPQLCPSHLLPPDAPRPTTLLPRGLMPISRPEHAFCRTRPLHPNASQVLSGLQLTRAR
eukprot:6484211-Amphidinium_carterae.2